MLVHVHMLKTKNQNNIPSSPNKLDKMDTIVITKPYEILSYKRNLIKWQRKLI